MAEPGGNLNAKGESASVASGPQPGLCERCAFVRILENGRGSTFYLCERSLTDPRFRKYPALPVLHCPGFEPRTVAAEPTPH
jgi:hypothetical protein